VPGDADEDWRNANGHSMTFEKAGQPP